MYLLNEIILKVWRETEGSWEWGRSKHIVNTLIKFPKNTFKRKMVVVVVVVFFKRLVVFKVEREMVRCSLRWSAW